ncbi:MAG TPA: hemerythrin domain-containing protein [Kofleriaceae bacterium]
MQHQEAETSKPSIGQILDQHHREIEDACLAILGAGFADQPRDLVKCWADIEHQLADHMAAEEHLVIPAYQRVDPENAQELRDQHARLRAQAFEIGVAIQLHTIRCEQLQQFVAELRAHARNEEASLYRWADRHLAEEQDLRLRAWLR